MEINTMTILHAVLEEMNDMTFPRDITANFVEENDDDDDDWDDDDDDD